MVHLLSFPYSEAVHRCFVYTPKVYTSSTRFFAAFFIAPNTPSLIAPNTPSFSFFFRSSFVYTPKVNYIHNVNVKEACAPKVQRR